MSVMNQLFSTMECGIGENRHLGHVLLEKGYA